MDKRKLVLALLALALTASCGGGGSDSTAQEPAVDTSVAVVAAAEVADSYQGTWSSGCIAMGSTRSERESIVITKQSATVVGVNFTLTEFAAANCSGAGVARSEIGTVTFSGTKMVGSATVDKGLVTFGTQTDKQIFQVSGNQLFTGRMADDGGTLDADGYPETLDTGGPLTRQ